MVAQTQRVFLLNTTHLSFQILVREKHLEHFRNPLYKCHMFVSNLFHLRYLPPSRILRLIFHLGINYSNLISKQQI